MNDRLSHHYPLSRPVRAPAACEPPPASLRRAHPLLLGLAAGALVVASAGIAFHLNRPQHPAEAPAEAAPAPPRDTGKPAPAPREEKPPAAAATPAPATLTKAQREPYLEALGGLSASHLYQSFLNLGLLADGVESGTYSVAEAKDMLKKVTNFMNLVDRLLARLNETGLEPEDKQALVRVHELVELLHTQAQALRNYWDSGDREHITRYHDARDRVWARLSRELGIE